MTRKERAAQHSPMYLYDFLQKLAPLRAAQIPAMESLRPNEVAYAWGDRKTAEEYTKDLPEKGEYFLLYAKKEALLTLYSRDVTPQAKYLDSLKTELPIPQEDGDSDLLEAVYSGNELKKAEMPVLANLENNPLNLEIFVAQTKYFFAKYIESRFCEYGLIPADEGVQRDFDDLVRQQLEKMRGGCWKSKNFTGIENLEFDYFVQQLELLITLEPETIEALLCPGRTRRGNKKPLAE